MTNTNAKKYFLFSHLLLHDDIISLKQINTAFNHSVESQTRAWAAPASNVSPHSSASAASFLVHHAVRVNFI